LTVPEARSTPIEKFRTARFGESAGSSHRESFFTPSEE
jgi:hypothetical protein